MVKKWQKELDMVSKSLKKIDFEKILEDLLNRKFDNYHILPLSGYAYLYKLRTGKYRIVFRDVPGKEVEILTIKSRGQVYKGL